MRRLSLFAGVLLVTMPLAAAANDAAPAAAPASSAVPAVAAPLDPARLAAAQRTVDRIFPSGTYARIMRGSMDGVMRTVIDSLGTVSVQQIAALAGLPDEDVAKLGDGTLDQVMAIYDPAYRQRTETTMRVVMERMAGVMGKLEPEMRAGLARAYAGRFDERQLGELNAFFATPTGAAYAEQSMTIFLDPQVMQSAQKMMPLLLEELPAIQEAAIEATAKLPAPRTTCDLGKDEKARLAKLLGLPEMPEGDCEAATLPAAH